MQLRELENQQEIRNSNYAILGTLSPTLLWQHFGTLCVIPRGSGNEEQLASHIFQLASNQANCHATYYVVKDKFHNVLVRMPATPGLEHLPSLCLQSHIDMVLANDADQNVFPMPLQLHIDNSGKLRANKTTLGADNGIGVAAMLAVMTDQTLQHGPLELLFTTQEETGLIGAENFDCGLIQSKRFLNLDSEEEGDIYVGCAGGGRITASFEKNLTASPHSNYSLFDLEFSDFKGGHSGLLIHEGRGNAIIEMAQLLSKMAVSVPFELISLHAGSAMNAIPKFAKVTVLVPEDAIPEFSKFLNGFIPEVFRRYKNEKPKFRMEKVDADGTEKILSHTVKNNLLKVLTSIPNGALSMEPEDASMTQTSNSVNMLRTTEDSVTVVTMYRSSITKVVCEMERSIGTLFSDAGAVVSVGSTYVAWEPQFNTKLLAIVRRSAEAVLGSVKIKTIHAGLECAAFFKNMPDAEFVSFGPTMAEVHSGAEWVDVASVERFYKILLSVIEAQ